MLGGAAPIPASSGQTVRVRLNRSGDRQLNQALHLVVLTRLRYDPATRAYAQRRRAQGKTNREIRRCLVRYVSRQLYRLLEANPSFDPHRSVWRNDQRAFSPLSPGRHADQAAGSPVDGGGGSVRPEVVGVLLTCGSNRAGWLHCGLVTHRDRTTATRSAQPR